MRPKPRIATPDDVTIRRDGNYAIIDFNDQGAGGMNLGIGPEIEFMDDLEILQMYNDVVRSMLDSAQSWRPTEIAEGRPQIKFDRKYRHWSAEGHVLRCAIDCDSDANMPTIVIDNHRLSLQEFGVMLSHFNGWGMRIAFVSEDQLSKPPNPEVRKAPKRISKRELEKEAAMVGVADCMSPCKPPSK
jgi:hypothetical protein